MVSELRPRGIGEILDSAVALHRARFTRLVKVAVLVVVPVQALSAIVLLSAQPDHYSLSITGAVSPQYDSSSVALQLAAFIVVAVVGVLSTALVIAVCTRILADAYIDSDIGAAAAFRAVRPRVFAVVGTSLLVLLSEAVGVAACFVGVLVPLTLFAVAVPVLILERVGVTAAISRSVALTKGHAMHVLGLVLTAQLLSVILNSALAEGIRLLLRTDNGTVSAVIGQSIASTIAGVLTTPFVAAAVVALYFDLRIRDEAYDIQLLMQRNDARVEPRVTGVDPDAARRQAQDILSGRRFRSSPTPRPLRGPLQWLGDRISSLLDHLADLVTASPLVWISLLVAAAALVAWLVARQVKRRPARAAAAQAARPAVADTENADALEREADAAERDGDLARAVRLRFRAGLLRLGDRGAIEYRPSVTTGEVRRTLDSRRFDDLAGTFEAVTYGGQPADPPAVDSARREWPRVLEETGRR